MTEPTLQNVNPSHGLLAKATRIKSYFGTFEHEKYEKKDGEDFLLRNKIKLNLQDLTDEVTIEIIRVLTPFFEDPVSPQLELFTDNNETQAMTTLPFKKEEE
jgi:hypothetical protein